MRIVSKWMGPVALALVLAACGSADNELRNEIAADFERSSQGMISGEDANCMADAIIGALGADKARVYHKAMSGDLEAAAGSEPLTPEEQRRMTEAFEECDAAMM